MIFHLPKVQLIFCASSLVHCNLTAITVNKWFFEYDCTNKTVYSVSPKILTRDFFGSIYWWREIFLIVIQSYATYRTMTSSDDLEKRVNWSPAVSYEEGRRWLWCLLHSFWDYSNFFQQNFRVSRKLCMTIFRCIVAWNISINLQIFCFDSKVARSDHFPNCFFMVRQAPVSCQLYCALVALITRERAFIVVWTESKEFTYQT